MSSSPRHNPFCARCGIAALLHAMPETSCEKYIAPGSKEARELRSELVAICQNCQPGHAEKKLAQLPCVKCGKPTICRAELLEATKVDVGAPIDSAIIDNRLLVATNEWLQARIAKATLHLQVGLSMPKGSPSRDRQFDAALKALGGLGAG